MKKNTISADEYRAFYDSAKVSGCFVLFDENKITEYVVNQQQYNTPFSPASTFKILNSLISIEEGAVENAETIVKWDGTKRQIEAWNRDQNMKTAFQNSTVWFYQELARRVGKVRMYQWLKKANYGNIDSSGPVDMMWLSGGLRITPSQQIDFLKSLKHEKMPFSKRTYKIVKEVMIAKDTLGCILRAKTGWSEGDAGMVGWYVGYIEKENNTYYFANCIQTKDTTLENFGLLRKEIASKILRKTGVISFDIH